MSKTSLELVRAALNMEVSRKPLDSHTSLSGYPIFYITSDCGCICPPCANKEIDRVAQEIRSPERGDQFRVVGVEVNYENDSLYCDHCENLIESAYGQ